MIEERCTIGFMVSKQLQPNLNKQRSNKNGTQQKL